jgi:hypothetical protein
VAKVINVVYYYYLFIYLFIYVHILNRLGKNEISDPNDTSQNGLQETIELLSSLDLTQSYQVHKQTNIHE